MGGVSPVCGGLCFAAQELGARAGCLPGSSSFRPPHFPYFFQPCSDRVLEWVRKLIGAPSKALTDLAQLQEATASQAVMLAYFEKFSGEEHAAFEQREWAARCTLPPMLHRCTPVVCVHGPPAFSVCCSILSLPAVALEQHDVVFAKTTNAAVAAELGIKKAPGQHPAFFGLPALWEIRADALQLPPAPPCRLCCVAQLLWPCVCQRRVRKACSLQARWVAICRKLSNWGALSVPP